jgi:hypothetical protein
MNNVTQLGLGFLGLVIVGVGSLYLFKPNADLEAVAQDLPRVVAESERLGMPLTSQGLMPPSPAESDNAAQDIQKLVALDQTDPDFGRNLRQLSAAINEKTTPSADVFKPFAQQLAVLEVATQKREVDFHRDWDMAAMLDLPELGEIRSGVRILAARAEFRAKNGDVEGALADVTRMGTLSDFVGQEPAFVDMLVQAGLETIRASTMRRIAIAWRTSAANLARLQTFARGPAYSCDLLRVVHAEAFMAVAMMRNLKEMGGMDYLMGTSAGDSGNKVRKPDAKRLKRSGLPEGPLERANLCVALKQWNKIADFIRRGPPKPKDLKDLLDQSAADLRIDKSRSAQWARSASLNGAAFMDFYMPEAQRQMSLAFITCMLIHAQTGKFPPTLPGAFADPYSEGVLQYLPTKEGFKVWSIGPDLVDQHGERRLKSGGRADLVTEYPIPPIVTMRPPMQ